MPPLDAWTKGNNFFSLTGNTSETSKVETSLSRRSLTKKTTFVIFANFLSKDLKYPQFIDSSECLLGWLHGRASANKNEVLTPKVINIDAATRKQLEL